MAGSESRGRASTFPATSVARPAYTCPVDRDALKQKLEDARYKAEGALGSWRTVDEDRRKVIIRLGIMGSVLFVLLVIGVFVVWRPFAGGGGAGEFQQARQVSDESRSVADSIRSQLGGRPEFSEVTITPVAITGDEDEYLMVYGGVPSQQAMDELRETIESAAPNLRVDWRITVVDPAGRLDPGG
jgi:hypothetical protein